MTPLIFVHGAGLQGNFWRYQTSFFADSVAIDLPGHGASPLDPLNDIRAYAEWMIGWAREIHPGPVVIAGHSMGSLIALEAAAENHDFVAKLILIATSARMPVHRDLLTAAQRRDPAAATMLAKWNVPSDSGFGRPKRWAEDLRNQFEQSVAEGVMAEDLIACDSYDRAVVMAANVDCATLVILGERDVMTKPAAAQPMAAALADARVVVVEGAGHMIPLERPDAVNDAITLFLTTAEP